MVGGAAVDIGTRVIRWCDPGGFDGYTTEAVTAEDRKTGKEHTVRGPRYGRRKGGLADITQVVVHHSGGDGRDPGTMHHTLWMDRGLSVHFAVEDDGRVYQFLDAVDLAWHAGAANARSVGIECCLYPDAAAQPDYYSPANCRRRGNLPHSTRVETIHGVPRKVFVMPDAQQDACARLCAGLWAALPVAQAVGTPLFPSNNGAYPRAVVADVEEHVGLVGHMHLTAKKWDPAGMNFWYVEEKAKLYADAFRSARAVQP